MFFSVAFYLSLAVCLIGVFYKITKWFILRIGPEAANFSFLQRLSSAIKSSFSALLSLRLLVLLKVFFLDVLFQIRILKGDLSFLRLLMHIFIFGGFIFLFLMHALDEQITEVLFPDYASTLNPFMFLRNLFGAMVLIGLAIAWFRRKTLNSFKKLTNHTDRYAIIIIALIIISGFLLEGVKIISSSIFDQMVEDYAELEEPEEIKQLKLYWAKDFGVVFPDLDLKNSKLSELGRDLHEENCMDCHTRPNQAFVSYPISKILGPVATGLNKINAVTWLWYIHVLTCFIGLASLPFTKFFHMISSPVSLLANGISGKTQAKIANLVSLRAVGLDACVHCGSCTLHCSVAPVFQKIPNKNILPSEKLISLKALASGKYFDDEALRAFQEGSFICTDCLRCTMVCPVGINLQDLWSAAKKDLIEKGLPTPYVQTRDAFISKWETKIKDHKTLISPLNQSIRSHLSISNQADTFSVCFNCKTCTGSCPVVANYENPEAVLGMVPHQIMHALGMGMGEMVLGTRMIWDCATCYLCQEYCPQGVKITDIFYELRNLAHERLKKENNDNLFPKQL